MQFRGFLTVVALVLATFAVPAQSRDGGPTVTGTTYTFVTVDSVTAQTNAIYVTGILKGESAPSTHSATFYGSSPDYSPAALLVSACERKALLAMSKPGQYLLVLQDVSNNPAYSFCSLTRVNP